MPEFLPEPKEPVVSTSLALDEETIEWLDGIADQTKRSRSDVAREIFRNVRQASANPARRASDQRRAS